MPPIDSAKAAQVGPGQRT